MYMLKRIKMLAALCCATVIGVSGQSISELEVSYNAKAPVESDTVNGRSQSFLLLCNNSKAKYYNAMSEYCDSLTSTPEGKKKLRDIQMAAWVTTTPQGITVDKSKGNAPEKKTHLYVTTDVGTMDVKVYDKYGDDLLVYSEPYGDIVWSIFYDETRQILGYECLKATTDYHGRHWTVWFAPDIPVPFGPWKLRGLPGLIMAASTDGGFSFEVTGLEQVNKEITPVYGASDYDKTDRMKALADREYAATHRMELLQAKFGGSIVVQGGGTIAKGDSGAPHTRVPFSSRLAIEPDYDKAK